MGSKINKANILALVSEVLPLLSVHSGNVNVNRNFFLVLKTSFLISRIILMCQGLLKTFSFLECFESIIFPFRLHRSMREY